MKLLTIGYGGEQNARRVLIPIGPYQAMWPNATPQLVVVRPVDEAEYIAVTTVEEDNLVWVPSAVDCQYVGVGKCQVVFTDAENNVIGKSEIFVVQVNAAVGDGLETPPEPYEPWINSILAAADITVENAAKTTADAADAERYAGAASDSATAAEQAKRAIEDMDVAGNTLEPDSPVTITKTVDPETGAITLTFGIPQGEKGDPGPGITFHICTSEEYDPVTRIPTVANPEPNTFYLVPAEEPVSPDLFVEWIYTNNAWEQFGSASIDLSGYATVADTVLTTTLSRGRKAGTTVGSRSLAFGINAEATNADSYAIGNEAVSTGINSISIGRGAVAGGNYSSVFGSYNVEDTNVTKWPSWVAGTHYYPGDKVFRTVQMGSVVLGGGFVCVNENTDETWVSTNWKSQTLNRSIYAEIIGNGTGGSARSNAYALDWDGNGHYAGDVYVGANADSSGGTKLATVTDVSAKADKADTVLDTTLSRGRKPGTTVGEGSFAFGQNLEADGAFSHAEGGANVASGSNSHAEGGGTIAKGSGAHSEGMNTIANENGSHAEGLGAIANGRAQHAAGKYNVEDSLSSWPEWMASTAYEVGDKVKVTTTANDTTVVQGYTCKTANSDSTFTSSKWTKWNYMNFAEIIGNGTANNARSNARALSWEGNEYLMGDVYVHANADSSGGTKLVSETDYATADKGGVVKVGTDKGLAMSTAGQIVLAPSPASYIKAGTNQYSSIAPKRQHEAVYYGLSKAAGVDLANETVTVGTYPATSQTAIKSMLGVQDGLRVVRLI